MKPIEEKIVPALILTLDSNEATPDTSFPIEGEWIASEVFENKEHPIKVAEIVSTFVESYTRHKHELPLETWLQQELEKYPEFWPNSENAQQAASELISGATTYQTNGEKLRAHHDRGLSSGDWLLRKVEEGALANGVVQTGVYAEQFERAIEEANARNMAVITCADGAISQTMNLDGFIAEQHHVNTFNIDAAAKGSTYRAKVLEPAPGKPYERNSMDIGIYDVDGKLVKRYQAKYGKDAQVTDKLFEQGDYRGQSKLVPEGHSAEIQNSTEVIEIGGIRSKPLTKEEAKVMQDRAQRKAEARQYDWNEMDKTVFARQLGKQVVVGACLTAAFHGGRILGRRAWNWLRGRENSSPNEDMREFFESSLQSTAHLGVQVAVSGGLLVAAKSGWLGKALKSSPVGRIATIAMLALENAKVLFKLGKGELDAVEALDAMGSATTTALVSTACAVEGAALGASVGSVLGPVGTLVGGFVGGIAGGIAGSSVGDALYEGAKAVVSTAVDTVNTVVSGVRDFASNTWNSATNFVSSIFNW